MAKNGRRRNWLEALLTQKEDVDPEELEGPFALIAGAIRNEKELPYLLGRISELEPTRELRIGLAAVQIECELKMHEDLNEYQVRKYAASVIEKALFGDEFLEGEVSLVEEDEKEEDCKKNKKKD